MALKGPVFPGAVIPHLGGEGLGCKQTGFYLNGKREVKIVCNRRYKLSKRLHKDLSSLPTGFSLNYTSILTPTSQQFNFQSRSGFLHNRAENPQRRSSDFRVLALPGHGFSGFESALSVIQAVAVVTAIVVVHESGHFLAAYLQGIHVSKFAVGFGPILAKFNSNNVEYSLRAFPLGGFVGFPDNDPDSDIPVDDENLLKNRPIMDRIIVSSAGVIANIIFAYAIIFAQVVYVGLPIQKSFPGVLVPEVRPFSAASRDGLLPGDLIVSVNGVELAKTGPDSALEVVNVIKNSPSSKVLLKVERGNRNFEVGDKSSDGSGRIGVELSPNVKISNAKPSNLTQAFNYTGKEFRGLTFIVLDSLKQTFLNFSQTAGNVSGPVAVVAVGAELARSKNINGLYQFAAVLNINLAVLNLLHLPSLDGGKLALILVEAARGGTKLPLETEQRIVSSAYLPRTDSWFRWAVNLLAPRMGKIDNGFTICSATKQE